MQSLNRNLNVSYTLNSNPKPFENFHKRTPSKV